MNENIDSSNDSNKPNDNFVPFQWDAIVGSRERKGDPCPPITDAQWEVLMHNTGSDKEQQRSDPKWLAFLKDLTMEKLNAMTDAERAAVGVFQNVNHLNCQMFDRDEALAVCAENDELEFTPLSNGERLYLLKTLCYSAERHQKMWKLTHRFTGIMLELTGRVQDDPNHVVDKADTIMLRQAVTLLSGAVNLPDPEESSIEDLMAMLGLGSPSGLIVPPGISVPIHRRGNLEGI